MKFCKLADITDWDDSGFLDVSVLLKLDKTSGRKVWEYIHVYKGLKHLGLLNEGTRVLGLGVGREQLVYAFTNVCGEVVATDLYNSANWNTAALAVEEVYQRNPFPYQPDRLKVQHMDMTNVEYPDNSFDCVWSCCAIEHVNTFKDLHRVFQEIHRVLKPGGVAALTTEYNMSCHHSYEPNMLFTDPYWIEKWFTGEDPLVQGFELIDPPSLTLPKAPGNCPQPRRQVPRTSVPLYSRDIIINSVAFFLRKAGEFSHPYDENWLPQPLRRYLDACEQQRLEDFAGSEAVFEQLLQEDSTDDRLKLAAGRRLLVSLEAQSKHKAAKESCKKIIPFCHADSDTDHLAPIANYCRKYDLRKEANHLYQLLINSPGARDVQVVRALLGQAEYCYEQNLRSKALKLAEQACENVPTHRKVKEAAQANYYRGFYLEKVGFTQQAMEAYQLAIAGSPASSEVHRNATNRLHFCQGLMQNKPFRQFVKGKVRQVMLSLPWNKS